MNFFKRAWKNICAFPVRVVRFYKKPEVQDFLEVVKNIYEKYFKVWTRRLFHLATDDDLEQLKEMAIKIIIEWDKRDGNGLEKLDSAKDDLIAQIGKILKADLKVLSTGVKGELKEKIKQPSYFITFIQDVYMELKQKKVI